MKKINNRGFAISVLIYSLGTIALLTLLLILSTLSGMRKNESSLAEAVKEDLNAMSRIISTYGSKEEVQVFHPVTEGDYKIQLWGASGGSPDYSRAGLGGYVSFTIHLSSNDYIYLVVGDQGKCPDDRKSEFDTAVGSEFTTGGKGYLTHSISGLSADAILVGGCNGGGATFAIKGDRTKPSLTQILSGELDPSIIAIAGGGGGTGLKGGHGGHACSTSCVAGTKESSGTLYPNGEYVAGNLTGAGASINSKIGGSLESKYYKWNAVPALFTVDSIGYAGSGGGGGFKGGNYSSGSYTGAGGGSNFINSTYSVDSKNFGGDIINTAGLPKKDTSGTLTHDITDVVGDGFVIIEKQ